MNQINEKWGTDYQTPKSKRGMFKGRSLASLEKQAKTAHGTKAKQVNFAIRAKKAHGGKWKGVTAEETDMEINELSKKTMGRYLKKASDDVGEYSDGYGSAASERVEKRLKGIKRVGKKLAKEEEEMTNPYQNMIVAAVEQKPDDFSQEFNAAIQEKLQGHVASFKEYLTATLLGDEPVEQNEEEEVDEGEAHDILDVFEMFLDNHTEDHFANLEEAVAAFAHEVELTEDEAIEFYDYLTEDDEEEETEKVE